MLNFVDHSPAPAVQESEYLRLLGFPPDHALSDRARELVAWARSWYAGHGRPWVVARNAGTAEASAEGVRIGTAEFSSQVLREQFANAGARDAVLVAVSAGRECEEMARSCWEDNRPDEYFFLEMYGSAVVEALIAQTAGRICESADKSGMAALPHYSPGYSGWPVTDQSILFQLLFADGKFASPAVIEVLETGMLKPKKSLLAVFGLTPHPKKAEQYANLVPCENCSLLACQYRRASYRHFIPQPEDVRRLQKNAQDMLEKTADAVSPLNANANYSVNLRALRKWCQERLTLKREQDGSIQAHFRYEGTTCANMGYPLEFDYQVRLSPPGDAYRILDSSCQPAPGDTGHMQQCEYLSDADSLMRSIATEKPLLGRPLRDALTWNRLPAPSGCFCDFTRRYHKWGLVFEVIHFALSQQANSTNNGNAN